METSLSQPITYLALFGVAISLVLFLFGFKKRRWTRCLLFFLALGILLPSLFFVFALNAWLIDARYRTYRDLYYDIEIGMTRAEVHSAVEKNYPADGPRKRPTVMRDQPNDLGFFMNPEQRRAPNCEGIFLTLQDGRVTGKNYSCD